MLTPVLIGSVPGVIGGVLVLRARPGKALFARMAAHRFDPPLHAVILATGAAILATGAIAI